MLSLWGLVTGLGVAAGLVIGKLTGSTAPIGIFIFSDAFWTSYNATLHILTIGNYLPDSFILLATVGVTFLFIAAVIGMLTGSG